MSTAREAILKAVVKALPLSRPDAAAIAAEARLLIGNPGEVRPALPQPGVTDSFLQRVAGSKVGATADRIAFLTALPNAVARYLAARNLPARIALQPRIETET